MRYAITNGGKRVRPVLTYATGTALGVPLDRLDVAACSVEMMHAYSLVHDDLPAMDPQPSLPEMHYRRWLSLCWPPATIMCSIRLLVYR